MNLPPLNLSFQKSQDSTSALNMAGAGWDFSQGDWIINMGGSGTSAQSAAGSSPWLWIALAAAAYWVLKK